MTIAALILLLAVQGQAKATKPAAKPAPAAAKPAAKPASAAAKPAPAVALPPSPWTLRENKDASTGARFSSVSITGSAGYRFAVRCDMSPDPVISLQFIPPKGFGTQTEKLVSVLPDNAPASVMTWEFVGAGAINRSIEVFNIVKLVAAAKSLRVFTTDAAGEPVSDGFEGPGGDAIFRHVFTFCSTPYEPMTTLTQENAAIAAAAAAPPAPAPAATRAPIFNLSPTQTTPGIKQPPVAANPAPSAPQ